MLIEREALSCMPAIATETLRATATVLAVSTRKFSAYKVTNE